MSATQQLWVVLRSNTPAQFRRPTQVQTKNCKNVDNFIDAIKKKLQLPHPPQDITVHLIEDGPAMEPDEALPTQNTKQTALVVAVPPPPGTSPGRLT